jgi:hypothetical protein
MDAATLKTQHDALAAATQHQLQTSTAVLRNGTSSHRIASPASFHMLDAFERAARDTTHANVPVFVGSVDGALLVSAQLDGDARTPPAEPHSASSRKRRREDAGAEHAGSGDKAEAFERASASASEAVSRVRARLKGDEGIGDAAFEVAHGTITRVLRGLCGSRGEPVVESIGLSVRSAGGATAMMHTSGSRSNAASANQQLVVALRLSAGVAVPLPKLRQALGPCFRDGALTTHRDGLGSAFELPISVAGKVVEAEGQRTVLVMGTVPNTTAPTAPATA